MLTYHDIHHPDSTFLIDETIPYVMNEVKDDINILGNDLQVTLTIKDYNQNATLKKKILLINIYLYFSPLISHKKTTTTTTTTNKYTTHGYYYNSPLPSNISSITTKPKRLSSTSLKIKLHKYIFNSHFYTTFYNTKYGYIN